MIVAKATYTGPVEKNLFEPGKRYDVIIGQNKVTMAYLVVVAGIGSRHYENIGFLLSNWDNLSIRGL